MAELQLFTKRGTFIPNKMDIESSHVYLRNQETLALDALPFRRELRKVQEVTSTYNCTGFIFASRRVEVDAKYIHTFLKEDGYVRIPERDVQIGDLAVWIKEEEYTIFYWRKY